MKRRILTIVLCAVLVAGILSPMDSLRTNATETASPEVDIPQVQVCDIQGNSSENVTVAVSGNEIYYNSYIDLDETLEEDRYPNPISMFSVGGRTETAETAIDLPSSYTSNAVAVGDEIVSYLPDGFRNQNPYGTCWAHSAIGAVEASLIRKGMATGSIDLSERHLAYYMYNKGETGDQKGGTYGDYTYLDESYADVEPYLMYGGNNAWSMWLLASWCGPVAESLAPYDELESETTDLTGGLSLTHSTEMAYGKDACHVQNVYKIALGDMEDGKAEPAVKEMIMKCGALGMSYYSDDIYEKNQDGGYGCYYNPDITGTNHAVQVVGWDDEFPKGNFKEEAPGDGAWLIKNSWGNESAYSAQYGYFWLSYYDASINPYASGSGNTMRYAYVFDAEPADNYDHIYQYDGDSSGGYIGLREVSNRFVAGDGDGKWDVLRGVGIGVAQSHATGTVEIYRNLINTSGDPTQGDPVHSQKFYLEYPGYHTIPLTKDVYLADGSQFSVVFRFEEETDLYISYDSVNGWSPVTFSTYENQDVSMYSSSSGYWYDLADYNYVLRIKAYSDDAAEYQPSVLQGFTLNKGNIEIKVGESAQLAATQTATPSSTGVIDNFGQYWTTADASVATVSGEGLVQGRKAGQTTITVSNGNVAASCVVTVKAADAVSGNRDEVVIEKPGKTTLSSVSLTSSGKAKLKWKKVTGAEGYQVYRATSEKGTYKKAKTIKSGATTTVTLVANTGSKPYYYKVRAYKTISGKKVYGAFSTVKTCGPKKVSGAKAKAYSGKKIKITWKKTSNASGYVVYRATSKNGTYKKVKTITSKKTVSYTNKSLKKGKKYYYKVRAYRTIKGKKVYGPYSDVVYAKAKK
ncbi:MAG: hypothetical protein E7289_01595 [Lachnospiraceae bacterium]|nr:hypothetical protein [Lachnospiraceae bacterium]